MKALQLDPDYGQARYNLGNLYFDQERFFEAEREYKSAIKINPKNVFAHLDLANLYNNLGEQEKSEVEYKETLELGPKNAEAHFFLAILPPTRKIFWRRISTTKKLYR